MKSILSLMFAWVLLCGFQQRTTPQSGETDQKQTGAAQSHPESVEQKTTVSSPGERSPKTADENSNREKRNGNQDVYVVTPKKTIDRVERIINIIGILCTLALAAAAIVGICFGWQSLRAIQRQGVIMIQQSRVLQRQAATMELQTSAAEKAANSAQQSVTTLIEIERAWIFGPSDIFDTSQRREQVYDFYVPITNRGRSAGRIVKTSIDRIVAENLPSEPDYKSIEDVDIVLPPHGEWKRLTSGISVQDYEGIRANRRQKFYVYGFVQYDIGGQNIRETRFCYVYYFPRPISGSPEPMGFVTDANAPPAYTRST